MKTVTDIPGLKDVFSECRRKAEDIIGKPLSIKIMIQVHQVSASDLKTIVCNACQVAWDEVLSGSQVARILIARQLFCYLAYEKLEKTLVQIAAVVGYEDHSGVKRAVEKVKDMIDVGDDAYMPKLAVAERKLSEMMNVAV